MPTPLWIQRLKNKWNLKSPFQVVIVLIVFACTGFTVLFIKEPIMKWLSGNEESSTVGTVLYYIFILPLYNVLLLAYGFIFGQFDFFWQFERRFFNRITNKFKNKQ
ncbi:DUF6787 family protein [Chryseosolibacter indicus]|uniref:DUF6787 family protein n=1 Tax=Chryseosolibacter indicus TaxID=2782351 RepID=UPI0020B227EB|nr:DUF6787 family protein [Chryseosolibacter indicus]